MSTDLTGPVLPLSLLADGELKDSLVILSVWQVQGGSMILQHRTRGSHDTENVTSLSGMDKNTVTAPFHL